MNDPIPSPAISPLRQRLIDDMNMRRFSRETQRNYIRDVGRFATFLRRSLAIEASRLARNGRDWHTLIEFCGLVGTLIVDEDGIYDPRHPNDRLLLGLNRVVT
jgi:hypothetical protein